MIKSLYPFARQWSEKGSVWLIGDTHFNDNDCWLMDCDWPGPNEQIIILKQFCHKHDTLVILGDVGDPEYLNGLKCRKILIAGNHDKGLTTYEPYFEELYGGPLFISDKIVLSHEPLEAMPYVINFHGHNHNGPMIDHTGRRVNLAANVINYSPMNLGRLIEKGILKNVPSIHRWTIDKETKKKEKE